MADDATTDTTTQTETTTPPPDAEAAPIDASTDDATVLGGDEPAPADPAAEAEPAAPAVVAPEKYELTAPEGMAFDVEAFEIADPVFRELNLSNEAAQKLMPVAGEFATRVAAAALAKHQLDQAQTMTTMRREWLENAKGDAEIGGTNWEASTASAAKALDMLGFPKGSPFRGLLDETGFGNHPEMIRAFARIGQRVGEDTFERGGTGDGKPKSDRELFYPDYTKS